MSPHFLVLAGETRFRVFERFAHPGRTCFTLREVVSQDMVTPCGLAKETVGGRGASPGPSGSFLGSSDEHLHRVTDWVAWHIERFLLARPGQAWAFAACPRLSRPVLDGLRPSLRGSLVELVNHDLTAMAGSEALRFFKSRF
jgi:hypothetical protein